MQKIRKILFPFSWLYGGIVWLRNKFFDWNWVSSKSYDFPVICVGNLSVGGTGKSPMIEYLIRLLKDKYSTATLSRGYKRKTKGFYLVNKNDEAINTGDEPLQFKNKFSNIEVAVDENRQNGISQLRKLPSPPEIILLDDAFQHRKVKPGFSILLSSYDAIYSKDLMLPAGNLREPKSGAKRADIVVITKCPENISLKKQEKITKQLKLKPHQSVYFSYIKYADKITNEKEELDFENLKNFTLVTGIAKPQPLVNFLKEKDLNFSHLNFPDHHNFSAKEIKELNKLDFILTTEKDFMRLKHVISLEKLFYLPIQQDFIKNKENFDNEILDWVKSNS